MGVKLLKVGTKVKVANKNQINYPLKGVIVEKEIAPDGTEMSKVKFSFVEVWYANNDLKIIK